MKILLMKSLLMKARKRKRKQQKRHHKAELPLSLVESNILPRLPVKLACRCMCVCKQWKSFLSTPTFARLQHQHVTSKDYRLTGRRDRDRGRRLFDDIPNPRTKFYLASLDGLLCLASRENPNKLELHNPLTGAYKKLSSSYNFDICTKTSYDAMGFYIDSANDYKLLCIKKDSIRGAYIYSNRLDTWRDIEFPFHTSPASSWSPGNFWVDCLYFTRTNTDSRVIICFNVKTETFRQIPFPPICDVKRDYCGILMFLNGCIHLCVDYYEASMVGTLWRMDGDDGWVKVAANNFTWQNICNRTGKVLWEGEKKYSFQDLTGTEEFRRHWCHNCSSTWTYKFDTILYYLSLVSPNP